jgi:hypothetical protein
MGGYGYDHEHEHEHHCADEGRYATLKPGQRVALGLLALVMFTIAGSMAYSIYDTVKAHYQRGSK